MKLVKLSTCDSSQQVVYQDKDLSFFPCKPDDQSWIHGQMDWKHLHDMICSSLRFNIRAVICSSTPNSHESWNLERHEIPDQLRGEHDVCLWWWVTVSQFHSQILLHVDSRFEIAKGFLTAGERCRCHDNKMSTRWTSFLSTECTGGKHW